MHRRHQKRSAPTVTSSVTVGGVAQLHLDYGRPARPTAMMAEQLRAQLVVATHNDDVDCILLRAAPGSHFGAPSSGEMPDVASLTRQLDQISKPCIAAVSGYCADLGLALTLACDIVIAARSARFQISRGPDSEYVAGALAGRIGRPRANALLMLGTFVDGSEAVAIGLAQRCVHDRDLDGEVKNQLASIRRTIAECREVFGQS